jgi:hypothetical protein
VVGEKVVGGIVVIFFRLVIVWGVVSSNANGGSVPALDCVVEMMAVVEMEFERPTVVQ